MAAKHFKGVVLKRFAEKKTKKQVLKHGIFRQTI